MEKPYRLSIVFASENLQNYLVECLQEGYDGIIFVLTPEANKRNWIEPISKCIKSDANLQNTKVDKHTIQGDESEFSQVTVGLLRRINQRKSAFPALECSFSLAGGKKNHLMALQECARLVYNSDIRSEIVIPDLQDNTIKKYYFDDSHNLVETKTDIEIVLSLEQIVTLNTNNISISREGTTRVLDFGKVDTTRIKAEIARLERSRDSTQRSQAQNLAFELKVIDDILKYQSQIQQVYHQVKFEASDDVAFCELDIVIILRNYRMIVLECKDWSASGSKKPDETALKIFTSHKAPIDRLGAKFATYVAVVNDPGRVHFPTDSATTIFIKNAAKHQIKVVVYRQNGLDAGGTDWDKLLA